MKCKSNECIYYSTSKWLLVNFHCSLLIFIREMYLQMSWGFLNSRHIIISEYAMERRYLEFFKKMMPISLLKWCWSLVLGMLNNESMSLAAFITLKCLWNIRAMSHEDTVYSFSILRTFTRNVTRIFRNSNESTLLWRNILPNFSNN